MPTPGNPGLNVHLHVSQQCIAFFYEHVDRTTPHHFVTFSLFLAGKYLNNYGEPGTGTDLSHIPPGWTRWFTLQGNRYVICTFVVKLKPILMIITV